MRQTKNKTLDQCLHLLMEVVDFLTSSEDAQCSMDLRDDIVIFTVKIPQEEAGRVIGKYGDTIKSIRSVFYNVTMSQHRLRSNVIVEPI